MGHDIGISKTFTRECLKDQYGRQTMSDDLEKVEKAEKLLDEVEQHIKKGLIGPIKGKVKLTKEYVEGLRNKVSDFRVTTREDMEAFRETMSVVRDTVTAMKGSATKEDMESFRATMRSVSETMLTVRDTVESIRQTLETVREIIIMARMLRKDFVTPKQTNEHAHDSQTVHNEGNVPEVRESVEVDKE